jgi:hypothetical protein
MLQLAATDHACQRARQRPNWNRAALERMLERIVYAGIAVDDCTGALARFLEQKLHEPHRQILRVYGEHLYVFARHDEGRALNLLTVYALPPEHREAARRVRRQCLALAA